MIFHVDTPKGKIKIKTYPVTARHPKTGKPFTYYRAKATGYNFNAGGETEKDAYYRLLELISGKEKEATTAATP